MIVKTVLDLIGQTPVFEFDSTDYEMPKGSKIYAKLEYLNPGGSIKDRLGKFLVEKAIIEGKIDKSSTIIEPTAGNTGIGIALTSSRFGIKTIFVVPDGFSVEKQQLMKALGAKIVNTPAADGVLGAMEKAKALQKEIPNSFLPMQFENFDNPSAYQQLGKEIYDELGKVTSFVAGVGTAGSFSGTAEALLKVLPEIKLSIVEPEGSILNGGPSHKHEIEGIGVEFVPPFIKELPVHKIYTISDEEGFKYTRSLAKNQGLLVGSSSGAAFAGALREVQALPAGSSVVTLFPDGSDRYLSKGIYDESKQF